METRFSVSTGSRKEGEKTYMDSNFSTERSPVTTLLFAAKQTISLPIVRMTEGSFSTEMLREGDAQHSLQKQ
jgi:hypothetical protein